MDDTTFYLTPEQLDRLSSSHKTTDEGFEKVPIYTLGKKLATDTARLPSAAGGLFSTAAD
jgi:CubicO group peptidase (beta-lactamase class C family)